jgi:hypothetical protein
MTPQGHQAGKVTHERRDADVLNLFLIASLLLLIVGTCLLVSWGTLHSLNRERLGEEPSRVKMAETAAKFPQPRLLSQPGSELAKGRLVARNRLTTYGWVDRQAGVAHIPIKRAMELLLARGLPEAGAGQTQLQLMQSRPVTDIQPARPINSPTPEGTP